MKQQQITQLTVCVIQPSYIDPLDSQTVVDTRDENIVGQSFLHVGIGNEHFSRAGNTTSHLHGSL